MPKADEAQAITEALHTLLSAIRAHDAARPKREPRMTDSREIDIDRILAGKVARDAEAIVRDPVGSSLRMGVRALGERLNELGGFDAMQKAAGDVGELDPANEGRRLGLLNSRWDGIGDWHA